MDENDEGNVKNALNYLKSYKMDADAQQKTKVDDDIELEQEQSNKYGYPNLLADTTLERRYIGLILNQIKAIAIYYFTYDETYFVDDMLLNIYKKILFTDGEKYAPIKAKDKFNFSRESEELYEMKNAIMDEFAKTDFKLDETYKELKKLFILRKGFLNNPVKELQEKISDIINYELYDEMNPEDVEEAIKEVTVTQKFKRAVLNQDLTKFLVEGDNILTNGLELPFPILTKSFKGVRLGETAAYSMPSNYGKSRFIINLAANIAVVHQKKVLIISNEMSEEKMKLCLITTIINNPEIQKLHKQNIHVSENQLLEFKFRPDDPNSTKVDEDGFVIKEETESHFDFANRLARISSEFRNVIRVTNWFNSNLYNSIHFIDITDHTNDELKKVIMNYYYKEQVHYVFYDTLKTDIDNIGSGEELKKTATILSNLAQNFDMYIASSLQLSETATDPLNLSVADMAVSRTVKEVLDILCLFKQIHNEDLSKYEYSSEETYDDCHDLEKFQDPDVRYYSCVIDKNRAGPKPKLLFRLNLAYNSWEELGYVRLKSAK